MTRNMRDAGGTRAVGKALQHLSLRMTDSYQRIRPLHGFALGLARYAPEITRHNAFALCFELEETTSIRKASYSYVSRISASKASYQSDSPTDRSRWTPP